MRPPKEAIDGLFYQDSAKIRTKLKKSPAFWGQMPSIRDNGWRPVTEFPNLSAAKVIGFDTETYDPELLDAGPGWGRGKGHIIGASLSVDDGTSWYFPIRHGIMPDGSQILPPEHAAMNMDPAQVMRFLKHTLGDNRPKVGANVIYDIGWLAWEGVTVGGRVYDVQFAEALLNSEEPSVALENLAQTHLGEGKVTEELYEWLARWNDRPATSSQRGNLYVTPPCMSGPYAEADASLPIAILNRQWPKMAQRGVLELFDLECRLIPVLVKMRLKGAPVNVKKAEKIVDDLTVRADVISEKLNHMSGMRVNTNASLAPAFNALGIPIPTKVSKITGESAVSFDKKILQGIDHPFAALVLEHRGLLKVRDTFVQSYIIEKNVNGRLYCTFHPLKGEGGGTRSGRLSSSDPNLQNIPVRSAEGKLVRDAFDGTISGHRWRSFDYSSIEYRLLAHYATGPGSDDVRRIFAENPMADYHQIVADMILELVNLDIGRGPAKTINFGIVYGMALPALAASLKLPKTEAATLLDKYHEASPYVRATMEACSTEVHSTGMVRTLLNRASDFNSWTNIAWSDEGRMSLPYDEAVRKWGMHNVQRAMTHKALNRKLQGSAADVMKLAMVTAYEAGLFEEDACGMPILTVHDELDFEDKGDLDNPAWDELKRVMETCAAPYLKVPLIVEGGHADTWAGAH